ncbi:MAG: hypothetical protein GX369_04590 [Euryarchaeota archaeon]|nr:hypothetical protein [Euryarchaeota archaeon]
MLDSTKPTTPVFLFRLGAGHMLCMDYVAYGLGSGYGGRLWTSSNLRA